MRTPEEIAATKKLLDEVVRSDYALSWFREGYEQQEQLLDCWRDKHRELQQLYLQNVTRLLTVREARLLNVCRICRGSDTAPFIYDYGKEYAHTVCLAKVANETTS